MRRFGFFWLAASALCAALTALATTYCVDLSSATPSFPYTNWPTAAANIQDAVDAAADGDDIVVTNGVYATGGRAVYGLMTNRVAITGAVTVHSVNGPLLTVIQGLGVGPDATNGDGAIRCVYVGANALLSGFTLTNGHTRAAGDAGHEQCGGGAWCEVSGVISNCTLSGNSAYAAGGGAYHGTLNNCTLSSNSASHFGKGGGVFSGTLSNCILTGNSAAVGGGAYNCFMNNCILSGNSASGTGGGAYAGVLGNCTVSGNSASFQSGGVDSSELNNCIVYYNSASLGSNYFHIQTPHYTCTTPFTPGGPGNITNAPLFVNTNGWADLRLQSNSPCINSGNNSYAAGSTDLVGNPRISGGTADMGAFEFQDPPSIISYAWLQSYGLPTDGSADYTDPDGDSMNNWQEWIAGTNPTNAASVLQMLSAVPGATNVIVTWSSAAYHAYSLARATNLVAVPALAATWSNIAGLAGTTSFTDTNPPTGAAFYRVAVQPP